jgi:hypothetical protein
MSANLRGQTRRPGGLLGWFSTGDSRGLGSRSAAPRQPTRCGRHVEVTSGQPHCGARPWFRRSGLVTVPTGHTRGAIWLRLLEPRRGVDVTNSSVRHQAAGRRPDPPEAPLRLLAALVPSRQQGGCFHLVRDTTRGGSPTRSRDSVDDFESELLAAQHSLLRTRPQATFAAELDADAPVAGSSKPWTAPHPGGTGPPAAHRLSGPAASQAVERTLTGLLRRSGEPAGHSRTGRTPTSAAAPGRRREDREPRGSPVLPPCARALPFSACRNSCSRSARAGGP